ncbi:MAG: hypothetical protein ABI787_03315 [Spartobacteria bacterium]
MNHLRKVGLASFLFLGLGLLAGAVPPAAVGWSAQTAGIVSVACYVIGLVLALIAFMQSRRNEPRNGTTLFLGRGPLGLVALIVLYFFLRAYAGL